MSVATISIQDEESIHASKHLQTASKGCKKAAAAVDASRRHAMKSSCKPLSSICTVEEYCATGKQLIKACRGAPRYSHHVMRDAGQHSSTCCAHAWTPCYLAPQKLGTCSHICHGWPIPRTAVMLAYIWKCCSTAESMFGLPASLMLCCSM